jgi:hypothetical protein
MSISKLDQIKQLRPDDDPAGREKRVRDYQETMGPGIEAELWKGRAKLVLIYLKNPAIFPNGPDGGGVVTGSVRWFNPDEWVIEGEGDKERARGAD